MITSVLTFWMKPLYWVAAVLLFSGCRGTDPIDPGPTQSVAGKPYFRGTNVITDPSQPQIHVHLRFTQNGRVLADPPIASRYQ